DLAELVRRGVEKAGFAVDVADRLATAKEFLNLETYDAIILDLALPDGDGLDLLRRLRKGSVSVPVLVLTARDGMDERVKGLDSGADDYLVKPFHLPELVARIRALLRRPGAALGVSLTAANLTLDTAGRKVTVDGETIRVSKRELALLELLLRQQGNVVAHEIVERNLYSFADEIGSNAMQVMIHRLRRKLDEASAGVSIHTVRGIGYMLTAA
ncbi:MAG TPA: response regulator, partial [Stellaceae bacterium]|nr:response regulator [Stellaceae bacterium]